MRIYDISRELLSQAPYPGDPRPELMKISDMGRGDLYTASVLQACVHQATHADAPCHFQADGKGIEAMELERYLGTCYVWKLGRTFGKEDAKQIPTGIKRMLFAGSVIADAAAVEAIAELGIFTVGTDRISIALADREMEVHRALLSREIAILENLDLDAVEQGIYQMSALPIKIRGADGAFVRAILWEE